VDRIRHQSIKKIIVSKISNNLMILKVVKIKIISVGIVVIMSMELLKYHKEIIAISKCVGEVEHHMPGFH